MSIAKLLNKNELIKELKESYKEITKESYFTETLIEEKQEDYEENIIGSIIDQITKITTFYYLDKEEIEDLIKATKDIPKTKNNLEIIIAKDLITKHYIIEVYGTEKAINLITKKINDIPSVYYYSIGGGRTATGTKEAIFIHTNTHIGCCNILYTLNEKNNIKILNVKGDDFLISSLYNKARVALCTTNYITIAPEQCFTDSALFETEAISEEKGAINFIKKELKKNNYNLVRHSNRDNKNYKAYIIKECKKGVTVEDIKILITLINAIRKYEKQEQATPVVEVEEVKEPTIIEETKEEEPQATAQVEQIKEEERKEETTMQKNIWVEVEGIQQSKFNKINVKTNSAELIKELKEINKNGFKDDNNRKGYLIGWSNVYTVGNLKRILKKLNLNITSLNSNIIGFDIIGMLEELKGENQPEEIKVAIVEEVKEQATPVVKIEEVKEEVKQEEPAQVEEIRGYLFDRVNNNPYFLLLFNNNKIIKNIRKINSALKKNNIKDRWDEFIKLERINSDIRANGDYSCYGIEEDDKEKVENILLQFIKPQPTPIVINGLEEVKEEEPTKVEEVETLEEVKEETQEGTAVVNDELLKELISRIEKLEKENKELRGELIEIKNELKEVKEGAIVEQVEEINEEDTTEEEGAEVVNMFNEIMKELKDIKKELNKGEDEDPEPTDPTPTKRGDKTEEKEGTTVEGATVEQVEEVKAEGNYAGAIEEKAPANKEGNTKVDKMMANLNKYDHIKGLNKVGDRISDSMVFEKLDFVFTELSIVKEDDIPGRELGIIFNKFIQNLTKHTIINLSPETLKRAFLIKFYKELDDEDKVALITQYTIINNQDLIINNMKEFLQIPEDKLYLIPIKY